MKVVELVSHSHTSALAKSTPSPTKYLAPWAFNKLINSFQSAGRCIINPKRCLADRLRRQDPSFYGLAQPMPNFGARRVLG